MAMLVERNNATTGITQERKATAVGWTVFLKQDIIALFLSSLPFAVLSVETVLLWELKPAIPEISRIPKYTDAPPTAQ